MNYLAFIGVTAATAVVSCTPAKKEYASYELYPFIVYLDIECVELPH